MSNFADWMKSAYPYIDQRSLCSACGTDLGLETPSDLTTTLHLPRECSTCAAKAAELNRARKSQIEAEERARQVEERKLAIRRIVDHEIPRHYRDVADEGFGRLAAAQVARPEAVTRAKDSLDAPLLLLTGPSGSGKTTMAAAIVGALVQRAQAGDKRTADALIRAMWIEAPELARARAKYKLGDGEPPLVERAMSAPLLVIDELDDSPDRDGVIHDVLWHRHAEELQTIWTTGLSSTQILNRYGSGFLRRLTERNFSVVIPCAMPEAPAKAAA